MGQSGDTTLSTRRHYLPLYWSLLLAVALFVQNFWSLLSPLSANSDNSLWGYDFFGLPRCGIALLEGIPLAGSEQQVAYGPWATDWSSHPMMCAVLGIPLSGFADPKMSLLTANIFYLCFHIFALVMMMRPLRVENPAGKILGHSAIHWTFATLVGLFFPYAVVYHYGQYHAISVLVLTLLLMGNGPRWPLRVLGFVASALSKPLFAPAGLVLLINRKWREVSWIVALSVLGTAPWLFLDALDSSVSLASRGFGKLANSVPHWNQEQSLAKVFETTLQV